MAFTLVVLDDKVVIINWPTVQENNYSWEVDKYDHGTDATH
jgi:hypothetical protein